MSRRTALLPEWCPQAGAALMILVLSLLLASGYLFLYRANQSFGRTERDARTMAALAAAREALIARAAVDANRPGSLPCPDRLTNVPNNHPGDGIADMLAGSACPSYVGWLPWRTLDLPDLRDSSGERLWYALAPALRDDDSAQPVNNNSATALTLDGRGGIAALIIAPGAALAGKNRPSNDPADYLDGDNGNGDSRYVSGPASVTFNDQMIALDTATLFAAVAPRILGEMRAALACALNMGLDADSDGDGLSNPGVASGRFPYNEPGCAAKLPVPDFLASNGWYALVAYDRTARTLSLNGRTLSQP